MYCLVTGAAGFIGSHLCRALMEKGHHVWGIDSFVDFYPRAIKEANLWTLKDNPLFNFLEADINDCELEPLLEGINWVFHLAAQAGVRKSWGKHFDTYINYNIKATQRLLEACKGRNISKFVYASSSSVYGDAEKLPVTEDMSLRPRSPYGVTKLAGENLCHLYARNFGIPTVILRYFTVFGPWQRPDMLIHRLLRSCVDGSQVRIFGDGSQRRDFTFVEDIVEGTISSAEKAPQNSIFNLGSGNSVSINSLIALIEEVTGKKVNVVKSSPAEGDVKDTWADTSFAREILGWEAKTSLREGIKRQYDWVVYSLDAGILPPFNSD